MVWHGIEDREGEHEMEMKVFFSSEYVLWERYEHMRGFLNKIEINDVWMKIRVLVALNYKEQGF